MLGFGSFEVFSQSKITDFKFSLDCKVKDQVIFQLKDGDSIRYPAYRDGIKIGERFQIEFEMQHGGLYYSLDIDVDELSVSQTFNVENLDKLPSSYRFDNYIGKSVGALSSSWIRVEDVMGTISMRRYFKNDWQLIYNSFLSTETTQVLTADCMNMPKKFDRVLSIIESVSGELLD